MVAYPFRPPAGIPGTVTRLEHAVIEPQFPLATNFPTRYGVPIVNDASTGKMRALTSADTATSGIYRFLVRAYPTGSSQDPLGTSTPPTSGTCSAMRRGYMQVLLQNTTAAVKDGQVYARVAGTTSSLLLGGLEAAEDATAANTVAIPSCYFTGPADSAGNVEIAFDI